MVPIRHIEWEIAKGKVLENQKNAELAQAYGISHENNVSRIYSRFVEKIKQIEKDLVQAIELGLYEPTFVEIKEKQWEMDPQAEKSFVETYVRRTR